MAPARLHLRMDRAEAERYRVKFEPGRASRPGCRRRAGRAALSRRKQPPVERFSADKVSYACRRHQKSS
jgi:hypothetical protein